MGLDMYLNMKMYVGYSHDDISEKIREIIPPPFETSETNPKYITYEAAYWRKANAIHNWFVNVVQEGIDNCATYSVSIEQLKELRNVCQEVLNKAVLVPGKILSYISYKNGQETRHYEDGLIIENVEEIAELLPTESGFFFGSTEYDTGYLESVKYTFLMLDKILTMPMKERQQWEFTYTASW